MARRRGLAARCGGGQEPAPPDPPPRPPRGHQKMAGGHLAPGGGRRNGNGNRDGDGPGTARARLGKRRRRRRRPSALAARPPAAPLPAAAAAALAPSAQPAGGSAAARPAGLHAAPRPRCRRLRRHHHGFARGTGAGPGPGAGLGFHGDRLPARRDSCDTAGPPRLASPRSARHGTARPPLHPSPLAPRPPPLPAPSRPRAWGRRPCPQGVRLPPTQGARAVVPAARGLRRAPLWPWVWAPGVLLAGEGCAAHASTRCEPHVPVLTSVLSTGRLQTAMWKSIKRVLAPQVARGSAAGLVWAP